MEQRDFLRRIMALTEDCSIPFSEEQALLCHEHISLMLEWNRRYNLTRITGFAEIIEKHILDSLIPSRWLPQSGPAIDIGSGPGFPGIPLKILHPKLDMLLLESQRKKVSFLKVVLSRLPLQNLWALQGRWEELLRIDHPLLKKPFKLATMRAVRPEPEHLYVAASKVLQPDGVFAWWAGPSTDLGWQDKHREQFEKAGIAFEGSYSYSLPSASQPRYLFVWRKKEESIGM
jgi:16S rRNA (guanine527-N7)-methyltransferase